MPVQDQVTAAISGPAPLESGVSVKHEYTDVINVSGNEYDGALSIYLSDLFEGCGRVDLLHMDVYVLACDKAQACYASIVSVNSSATVEQAAMFGNGFAYISNSFEVGIKHKVTLVPPDTLSRQIQPPSSDLPMLKFMLTADPKMRVNVEFFVKVHGARFRTKTLSGK